MEAVQGGGQVALNVVNYMGMTKPELTGIAQARGLETAGTKADILQRIIADYLNVGPGGAGNNANAAAGAPNQAIPQGEQVSVLILSCCCRCVCVIFLL